jgi:1-deoxy-D-xylulose-5-phosphate synthase
VSILENIRGHEDLLHLNEGERKLLCEEIRGKLISSVSDNGGHLASNLGVVELTVAVETVFNTMRDRLVFDVGHQSYVHKLLSGRQADFSALRQYGGLSGFPKPTESDADAFVAGHASSSVSIALGMARARTMMGENYHVVALLGDGAATGGMVFEGLNDAAVSREPMVIILNDNEMSIDKNVGGVSRHLSRLRMKKQYLGMKRRYRDFLKKIPGGRTVYRVTKNIKDRIKRLLLSPTIFENMGLNYLGPVDGHDVNALMDVLKSAKDLGAPVVGHVFTRKGKGYTPAEQEPSRFHGIGKFDPATGESRKPAAVGFSDSFGSVIVELARENPRVCAITAAMPGGTGLMDFKKEFPKRLFDVGIAEEHAVSMAGGLAKQGMIPVVAIYSTFLQRSFDQIMQDIALQQLHVVLAVDRAGLVGEDGPTHHGVFDVGFLRQVPGMKILAPASLAEQKKMLSWAVEEYNGPVAVRYPRGTDGDYHDSGWEPGFPVYCHRSGKDIAIVTYGTMVNHALEAAELLHKQGIDAAVIRLCKLNPLPLDALESALSGYQTAVVVEEAAANSGIRDAISHGLSHRIPELKIHGINLGEDFIPHGAMQKLYEHCGMDTKSIAEYIQEVLLS